MHHVIDATNRKLGRLASEIAIILQGKNTAAYNPRLPGTGKVVVKNAGKMSFTGNKMEDKMYYHHTGYMGHLREKTLEQKFKESPEKVLVHTIYNMLPKNRLRMGRLKRLTVER